MSAQSSLSHWTCVGDRFRQFAEQFVHSRCAFQKALGIALQNASGIRKRRLMLKAGENIKDAPLRCGCVTNTVRGNERQFVGTCDFDDGLVALFLFIVEVTLKLDIDVVAPIDRKQARDDSSAFL
jgi:hypothetical protein